MMKMSRTEFQELVHAVCYRYNKHQDIEKLDIEWCTGGMTGGSCWDTGDSVYHPMSGEPEPEFEELDNLLLKIAPNLSFLHYKKLMQNVKYDDHTSNDYYGNYTTYGTKTITIDAIWNFLVEYNLIEETVDQTTKLYYCETYKNPTAKRRSHWFVVAYSCDKAQELVGHKCADGWIGTAELYDDTNEKMVKAFSKLSKGEREHYTDKCANVT